MNYPEGISVHLRKLAEAPGAPFPAAAWEDLVPGMVIPGQSLPIAYELEGTLLAPIQVGQPILLHRRIRNGVAAEGVFTSSIVQRIRGDRVTTLNSVYRVRALPEGRSRSAVSPSS